MPAPAHAIEQLEAGRLRACGCRGTRGRSGSRRAAPQRGVAAVDVDHLVAGLLERLAQHEADRGLVVGDQHARRRSRIAHGALRSGSDTRARVPRPSRLSIVSVPPCCTTQCRASERPSPVPCDLRGEERRRDAVARGLGDAGAVVVEVHGDGRYALAAAEVDAVVEAHARRDDELALAVAIAWSALRPRFRNTCMSRSPSAISSGIDGSKLRSTCARAPSGSTASRSSTSSSTRWMFTGASLIVAGARRP